jgi:hypothetical protein
MIRIMLRRMTATPSTKIRSGRHFGGMNTPTFLALATHTTSENAGNQAVTDLDRVFAIGGVVLKQALLR